MGRLSRNLILAGGLLCWLLLACGCNPGDSVASGNETDDPYYRHGDQLKRQGRYQEALGEYLKVIAKRHDDAPEAHLEAGLIYQQYVKDPLYAIYHFRRYLDLQRNSKQADLVRQRIEAAQREFARSLPGQPLESQVARLELMTRIDELQRENLQLKEKLGTLLTGAPSSAEASAEEAAPADEVTVAPPAAKPKLFYPPPAKPGRPNQTPPQASAPAPTRPALAQTPPARTSAARSQAPTRPAASSPAKREHVVGAGESLFKIAQKYYGNGGRWQEILEANRDQLKSENGVKPGMKLRIP